MHTGAVNGVDEVSTIEARLCAAARLPDLLAAGAATASRPIRLAARSYDQHAPGTNRRAH